MTDQDLMAARMRVGEIERDARVHLDGDERYEALTVLRHTTALRKAVDHWMAARFARGVDKGATWQVNTVPHQ